MLRKAAFMGLPAWLAALLLLAAFPSRSFADSSDNYQRAAQVRVRTRDRYITVAVPERVLLGKLAIIRRIAQRDPRRDNPFGAPAMTEQWLRHRGAASVDWSSASDALASKRMHTRFNYSAARGQRMQWCYGYSSALARAETFRACVSSSLQRN